MVYATKSSSSSSNHLFKQKSLKFFPDSRPIFIPVLLLMLETNPLQPCLNQTNLMKTTKMNLCIDACAVFHHLLQRARHHRPPTVQVGLPTPDTDLARWPGVSSQRNSRINVQQKPEKSHDWCQSRHTHTLMSARAHRNTVSAADVWLLGLGIQTRFLCERIRICVGAIKGRKAGVFGPDVGGDERCGTSPLLCLCRRCLACCALLQSCGRR